MWTGLAALLMEVFLNEEEAWRVLLLWDVSPSAGLLHSAGRYRSPVP